MAWPNYSNRKDEIQAGGRIEAVMKLRTHSGRLLKVSKRSQRRSPCHERAPRHIQFAKSPRNGGVCSRGNQALGLGQATWAGPSQDKNLGRFRR
jgi:hypothetical protein